MQLVFLAGSCCVAAYCLILLYFLRGWLTLPKNSYSKIHQDQNIKVSVIIPARNEGATLGTLLKSIDAQTYANSNIEVIVIDDFSTDNTSAIANSFPSVKLIRLAERKHDKTNAYKKMAIDAGVELSTGELIVTTDADCTVHPCWIEQLVLVYKSTQAQCIVMPVRIAPAKTPLQIFQWLDFMSLQGITGAATGHGKLSMCNGANFAYTRQAFFAVEGFKGIDSIASGDDMLLLHKIEKHFPGTVQYIKNEKVIVNTLPVKNIRAFFQQRIRWASKADKYDDKRLLPVLAIVYFCNVFMLILPLMAIFSGNIERYCTWFGALLAAKIITEIIFLIPVAGFFKDRKFLWLFPLAQPFHIIYTVIAGWLGKFGKYEWKGRSVN